MGASAFDLTESPIITNQSLIDDVDTGVGLVAGAMYRPVPSVSLGLVYARRPSFKVDGDLQLNAGRPFGRNGPFVSQVGFPKPVSLNVPDQVGAGAAVGSTRGCFWPSTWHTSDIPSSRAS